VKEQQATAAQMRTWQGKQMGIKPQAASLYGGWKEVGFDRARGGLRDKRRAKSGNPIHKEI